MDTIIKSLQALLNLSKGNPLIFWPFIYLHFETFLRQCLFNFGVKFGTLPSKPALFNPLNLFHHSFLNGATAIRKQIRLYNQI